MSPRIRRPLLPVRRRHRRRAGRRGDAGVAFIEFAIALPLLSLIAFGTFEAGDYLHDRNVLARSTHQAARTGSNVADDQYADYDLVRSLDASLDGLRSSSIVRVIVYESTTADGAVPTPCLNVPRPDNLQARGVSGRCNIYSATQVRTDDFSQFGQCDTAPGSGWDRFLCPTERNRNGSTPDRLGVYVELDFDVNLAFITTDADLRERAVFQLEPCVVGDVSC